MDTPLISHEERKAIDNLTFRHQIIRYEEICSVHWPQYNWKLLRANFMDLNMDTTPDDCMENWVDIMNEYLAYGHSTDHLIANLSSGANPE